MASPVSGGSSVSQSIDNMGEIVIPKEQFYETVGTTKVFLKDVQDCYEPDCRGKFVNRDRVVWTGNGVKLDLKSFKPTELLSGNIQIAVVDSKRKCSKLSLSFKTFLEQNAFAHREAIKVEEQELAQLTSHSFERIFTEGPGLIPNYESALKAYSQLHARLTGVVGLLPTVQEPDPSTPPSEFAFFFGKDMPPRTVKLIAGQVDTPGIPEEDQKDASLDEELRSAKNVFSVHDFVMHTPHAGGIAKALLAPGTGVESQTKEITFQEPPKTVAALVHFLYHKTVKIEDDQVARGLYHLAQLYDIPALKPYCEAGARRKDFADADPSHLASKERFVEALQGKSLENMKCVAEAARRALLDRKEIYLDPHLSALKGDPAA